MAKSKDVFVKKKKSAFGMILIILVILVVVLGAGIFTLYATKTVVASPIALQEFKDIQENITELRVSQRLKNEELQQLQKENSKTKNKINLRNLYYLNTQLAIYHKKYKQYPTTALNLQSYIDKIPNETYSGDNTIYGIKNNKGGWYYTKKGRITANIKR